MVVLGASAAVLLSAPALAAANSTPTALGSGSLSELSIPDLIAGLLPGVPSAPDRAADGKTRCTAVIQVGDSTSVNVNDPGFGDNTATARLQSVGVRDVTVDALGSRAIVGGPRTDAEHAIAELVGAGKRGCWVIAMGVNDAGAISGGGVSADERIDRVMAKLAGQPVLWPTVASSNPANPAFGTASMGAFNDALRRATQRYPNLAVYDWAAAAHPELFAGDGIHYTAAGTQARNKAFAAALATAFPTGAGNATPAVRWVVG
ncbi:MAG: SGNH/GDSL hydrolase family protein [Gordonia sp. (in: high G+C Gram-positive bacteria)]|uniref:GDSL-type esterase/lipase family protein n=1 Tax=Gordonia sp. (in: high G+C Gram-positive bacteria) TaxID=84139 RepID=UPI003BB703C3